MSTECTKKIEWHTNKSEEDNKDISKKGCSESEKVNLLDAFYYLSCVVRGGRVTTKYYKPWQFFATINFKVILPTKTRKPHFREKKVKHTLDKTSLLKPFPGGKKDSISSWKGGWRVKGENGFRTLQIKHKLQSGSKNSKIENSTLWGYPLFCTPWISLWKRFSLAQAIE